MWAAISWAIVAVVVLVLAWRAEIQLDKWRHDQRLAVESREREADINRQERLARLAEAETTREERAELEKAELLRKAAEVRVAAEVAEATVRARIAEEEQIIAARAEGRAAAAKDRALQGDGSASDSDIALLMDGYKTYVQRTGSLDSFDDWLGDIDIRDGRVSY